MPQYQYKARSSRGDMITGILEAPSIDAVASQLMNSDIAPIDIIEKPEQENVLVDIWQAFTSRAPGLAELIMFSRQMYSMMRAGIPFIRAMTAIIEATTNRILISTFKDIRSDLESGREPSAAFARHPGIFPPLYVSMVRVGENTGNLDKSFLRISQYLELEKETRERVKSAIRYPTMVIVAMTIAIGVVNVLVIPAFAKVFEKAGANLPWQTKILINSSNFFVAYWPYLLAGLIIAAVSFNYYIKTEQGSYVWGKYKIRLPLVGGILYRAALGRFTRAFSMSLSSGVPLVQALTVVSRVVDNDYIGTHILTMRNGIEKGESLTRTAATTGMFTPLVLQMLAVGEETGQVDEMMEEVAGFYEREVDYDVKNLSATIEPVMIVMLGILVLILALGIFLPMWDLASLSR